MSADAEIEARAEVGRFLGLNRAPNWQEVRAGLRRADNVLDSAIETGKLRPVRRAVVDAPLAGIVYSKDPTAPGYGMPDIEATVARVARRAINIARDRVGDPPALSHEAAAIVQAIVELIAQGDR